jgi:hypothetical protein
MPVKSFRGLIENNGSQIINLHTINGSIGYKITKFDIMPVNPFNDDYEALIQIFKVDKDIPLKQGTLERITDFSDNTLVAAGMYSSRASAESYPEDKFVIFDNEIFNQDIYIKYVDTKTTDGFNYYIELEQIKLDLNENTVATLKDIRNIKAQNDIA